jgi:hypothetical protein
VSLRNPDAQLRVLPCTAMPMQRQLLDRVLSTRHSPSCLDVSVLQTQYRSSVLHTAQISHCVGCFVLGE